jgi:predicted ArsR family transcriptional regulator
VSDQPEPVTVASLVTLTHLHENTIRGHLDALVRDGFVTRTLIEPEGRGRPAWLYAGTEVSSSSLSEHAGMVAALARSIAAHDPDPVGHAAESGEIWGRQLAREHRGALPLESDARQQLLEVMDGLGFAPGTDEHDPDRVRLTRCPFLEVATRFQEVVCAVHLGLARGVLSENGADPEGTQLLPFSEPGACILLAPTR